MKKIPFIVLFALVALGSCNQKDKFDASGTFETEETIISAEGTGRIKEFKVEEGQTLKAGEYIGFIDTAQLYFNKKNLEAQIQAGLSRRPDVAAQVASLQVQLQNAQHEQGRIASLVKADAATQKQLDDQTSMVAQIQKQIDAQLSTLDISTQSINKETVPLRALIQQISDQLSKCYLVNPVNGTVLSKYARVDEEATPGKPLYKIADISSLILRAYITNNQFSQLKLGQKVKVFIDNGPDKYKEYEGTVTWISDKAEFTPKTIETKDERANLVWATKITVKNDGFLKIGMYGEVKFQ
ncbi:MAG: HlyD family efflux transporter periplasmic adaptor subunit [Bacteroidota bacterium]|nr:HlyD family efflux transporter periplasmic adaptor subunit [Bacteroidota bacterium]